MNEQALALQPSPEPEPEKTGFLDRTLRKLKNAWQNIAGSSYDATQAGTRPDLPDADLESLHQQMRDCLQSRGGEVSARAQAAAEQDASTYGNRTPCTIIG